MMATKKAKADDVEVKDTQQTSEVAEEPKEVITFIEYLKRHTVSPLLVASFSYEASRVDGGTDPRTEDEWARALEAQSKRVY